MATDIGRRWDTGPGEWSDVPRILPGAYHRVRLFAASFAALAFVVLGVLWAWAPAYLVAAMAAFEVGHAAVHIRRGDEQVTGTIVTDIVVVCVALAVFRPPTASIIPAFGYLVAAPILLAAGTRAIVMAAFALLSFTAAGYAGAVWPATIEWTQGRTWLITVVLLIIFGPLIAWLMSPASRQMEERERYRRALETSERRLADIFRHAPIGMELTQPHSLDIKAVNPALCEFLGYSEQELLGMSIEDIVHHDDLAAALPEAEAVTRGELRSFQRERRYIRSDGQVVWGSFHLATVTGPDGTPELMVGQVRDITASREAHRQRDLLLDLSTEVIASSSTGEAMEAVLAGLGRVGEWTYGEVWVPDQNGDMVRTHVWHEDPELEALVHSSAGRMTAGSGLAGLVSAGTTSMTVVDVTRDDRFLAGDLVARFGLESAVGLPVTHEGRLLAVLILLGPAHAGDLRGSIATIEAVTAQLGHVIGALLAEDERDRLAAILENTTDFVGLADPSGIVQWVNPAGRAMLGLRPGDKLVGRALASVHPIPAGRHLQDVALRAAGEHGVWRGETTLLNRDGNEIPVSQVVLAHRDRTGDIVFFSTVARDISDQKELERHQESLIQSKNDFIASVSHELRTPLTGIQGFAELLVDPAVEISEDERLDMLRTIAREAVDVGALVEDLLVAARAEIDQLVVEIEPVRVDALVRSAHEVVRWNGHHVHLAMDPVAALADPQRLRQILRNLLTNAARYGGANIRLETKGDGEMTHVRVADDGPGIPPELRDRVFDAYSRGRQRPGLPESVGLGLTVSRQLARLMGGDVTYRKDEEWSVFEVTLPRPA